MAIEFRTRLAKVLVTDTARLKRFQVANQPYSLVEVKSMYGLPDAWLVVRMHEAGEYVAARARTRRGAERRCQQMIRRGK